MNQALIDKIVSAVVYEGSMLYPYRPAIKNRHRWTFGVLYPQSYSAARGGADAWTMQTECLVHGSPLTALEVQAGFLHLAARQVGQIDAPIAELPEHEEPEHRPVESLQVGPTLHRTWQDVVERKVAVDASALRDLLEGTKSHPFAFPGQRRWPQA